MEYDLFYLPEALASLKRMSPDVSRRIVNKTERMRHGLSGDVKRLKAFVPNYRLHVGDWRVLFGGSTAKPSSSTRSNIDPTHTTD